MERAIIIDINFETLDQCLASDGILLENPLYPVCYGSKGKTIMSLESYDGLPPSTREWLREHVSDWESFDEF